MTVSLTHLAESIFVAMVNQKPGAFITLPALDQLDDARFDASACVAYREVALDRYAGREFDGASRVDAIVTLTDDRAVPFELKLGTARLTRSRIDTEWLAACDSSHDNPRWRGNMMAILERKFKGAANPEDLVARVHDDDDSSVDRTFILTRTWFVVARRKTISGWANSKPDFSSHVKYLVFEDVVDAFGGKTAFNTLVGSLLDFPFYETWFAADDDAG